MKQFFIDNFFLPFNCTVIKVGPFKYVSEKHFIIIQPPHVVCEMHVELIILPLMKHG